MVLFKFKISAVSRDHFSSSDDDMDSEGYETESNTCTGNFSHLKDLISTYVNNISTSPSEVETEDQPEPSSRSNLWFNKRLECPICFKKFNFNDIESHASNCASKFDCNEIEVTYEELTNEQLEVTIPL